MAPTEIVSLGDPGAHDPEAVGGKAASLSRLATEYRVPPGFAVTSHALGLAAPELARGSVPRLLRDRIDEAYASLGFGKVAVRSSAIDEDGDAHSFAGQHETFLNVEGGDAIAEAVVLCFASAFTARALDYRLHMGLPVDHIGLAILIQAQVPADSAAVVFSANPINGRLDEIVINASYGLGESIVGGTTTPDTFVLRKSDLEVVSETIGEKRLMTVPVPGGTRELETPALLRDRPSITAEQAPTGCCPASRCSVPVSASRAPACRRRPSRPSTPLRQESPRASFRPHATSAASPARSRSRACSTRGRASRASAPSLQWRWPGASSRSPRRSHCRPGPGQGNREDEPVGQAQAPTAERRAPTPTRGRPVRVAPPPHPPPSP